LAKKKALGLDKHITSKRIWSVDTPGARLLVRQLKGEDGHDDGRDALEMAVSEMETLTALGGKITVDVGRPEIEKLWDGHTVDKRLGEHLMKDDEPDESSMLHVKW